MNPVAFELPQDMSRKKMHHPNVKGRKMSKASASDRSHWYNPVGLTHKHFVFLPSIDMALTV
jgi:hypothetical protein